ncbi:MAG TPA: transketolase C-terminal domain-containing protein, partial [Chloroflexota bacterium]|nr:transketolase C-terminal domain-containing protein [Chloroflexota bacterium]
CAEIETADAETLVIAFGMTARIALSAVRDGRAQGRRVGLLRPISLSPFPHARIAALAALVREILVVEMNAGQMVDDVRLAVGGRCPVHFLGHTGGLVPLPDEILSRLTALDWSVAA